MKAAEDALMNAFADFLRKVETDAAERAKNAERRLIVAELMAWADKADRGKDPIAFAALLQCANIVETGNLVPVGCGDSASAKATKAISPLDEVRRQARAEERAALATWMRESDTTPMHQMNRASRETWAAVANAVESGRHLAASKEKP